MPEVILLLLFIAKEYFNQEIINGPSGKKEFQLELMELTLIALKTN